MSTLLIITVMYSKILNNLFKNTCRILFNNEFQKNYKYKSRLISQKISSRNVPRHENKEAKQEELLSQALEYGKVPAVQEWSKLRNSILTRGTIINEVNFDAKAIGLCVLHKNIEAAKTLLQFYKNKNENLNIAAVGKFMKLYHVCNADNKVNKEDELVILSMYKNLKQQYPILSSITAENVIHAISLTKEWKDCLDLLKDIKLTERPTITTYNVIIKAAFNNNELDLGWNLINEMNSENKFPHPTVYATWLQMLHNSNKLSVKNVQFLFNYFADNEILITKDILDQILEYLKPYYYFGTYTSISKRGVCNCCNQKLQEVKINAEEFNHLKSVFMDNVIIGKNIFTKTNPTELQQFKDFVSSGNYDLVIDGLNVAYSAGNKKRPEFYGQLLANVVRHFRSKNKNILVLGRVHMNKWPKRHMDYIRNNASMFLAQDISQDDPFLLYATMSSGLNTDFLSRDFMRGHLYLLMDSTLKKLFRKWQQTHQHSLIYAENNGQIHIKNPFSFLCTAQNSVNGWHIPYIPTFVPNLPLSCEPPNNWLCIRKK